MYQKNILYVYPGDLPATAVDAMEDLLLQTIRKK